MTVVALGPRHRQDLVALIHDTDEFSDEEKSIAVELVDEALSPANAADADGYRVLVAEEGTSAVGYVCFGRTPMTDGAYDLYWIAVDPRARGRGAGRELVEAMAHALLAEGGRFVRVETSGLPTYAATRAFYERTKFEVVARIRDFYRRGDDLVIYGKYL